MSTARESETAADVGFDAEGAHLIGSRDEATGQTYYPRRPLAADGSLRACVPVRLSSAGTLVTWTSFAGRFFGQVDLPEGVRVQTLLGGEEHVIGARYGLVAETRGEGKIEWRFVRV